MATEPKYATHWPGCWRSHDDCCEAAVEFLAEGAEPLMADVLANDDEDPNALEMRHRLHLLGFTQTDLTDSPREGEGTCPAAPPPHGLDGPRET